MSRKIRVVNKRRFYTFIAVVAIVIVASVFTIFSENIKAAEINTEIGATNSGLTAVLDQYDLELVTVKPGDTYWQIQEEHLPDEDVRMLKFYAEFINEKSMGELQAWEQIFVFAEKGE